MSRLTVATIGEAGRAISELSGNVQQVLNTVERVTKMVGRPMPPRVVAVSKSRSVEQVRDVHGSGIRHFGENYVKELYTKATQYKDMVGSAGHIQWHFIGCLQKRNAKRLSEVPGLWMVETLDSLRIAQALNGRWGQRRERDDSDPLCVMVQVNTSGEETKCGCCPSACVDLAHYILEMCPHLKFRGLMVIGRQNTTTLRPNPDFKTLLQCRESVQKALQCSGLELSMGMTDDYEHAIHMGSTNIRIGRAIFGPRP